MKANKNYNTNNFTQLQGQVNDVKDVMTENIDKILKRGDKLEDLVDKTNDLESSAIQFNVTAKKVKRKMWWKNLKMMFILGMVILIILAVIITVLVLKFGGKSGGNNPTTSMPVTTTVQQVQSDSKRIIRSLIESIKKVNIK